MKILETRIDDRLIHGQIVTAWIQATGADAIIVADDNAAGDALSQSILKMATPDSVQLIIKSLSDAAELIKKDKSEVGVLLIVSNASGARKLLESDVKLEKITLGNITNKKSGQERKMVLKFIFASEDDAENLRAISNMGVIITAQTVPNDKAYDVMEIMKKAGFYK
ncbi:MAG: PTS sugar transporter subunit IIB [Synergistaceae bacterium]|jgi:mannose/fructose/N-acetylgalactosamine-specific phosphotransferase system component IIB|nr:PTS sugar transporter subunit IIB [Synergistaceae bacterium]